MWGSIFSPGDPNVKEEDYYIKYDFTEEEIKEGLAVPVQKFCDNCHNEREPKHRDDANPTSKV